MSLQGPPPHTHTPTPGSSTERTVGGRGGEGACRHQQIPKAARKEAFWPVSLGEAALGHRASGVDGSLLSVFSPRITDEDEDEDGLEEEPLGTLPTLILSDTLKTGLRRDYTGDLTKKIIESM